MKTLVLSLVVSIAVIIACLFMYDMSVDNRVISLENLYTKQLASIETYHDKMWKTIKSQAKITDKQKNAFQEVYVGIMAGRYSEGGGSLMKWIKEDNPKFDQSSYLKLMSTVEAQRAGFFREQDMIQTVIKEFNDLLRQKPAKWFIDDSIKPLVFEPISSEASKEIMKTKKEDKLFLD